MSETRPTDRGARGFGYLPGLDGMRALGVIGVIVAHAGYHSGETTLLQGSFFAISMFFTLSGFLITALLVHELDAAGGIDLRSFWARRFRRLMPGALLGVAAVLVFALGPADSGQLQTLRGDVAGALSYTMNWRLLLTGNDYANQLGSPTPLLHYWSLAIEEQFYVLVPLVLVGAHRLGRGRRRAAPVALAVLGALSLLTTAALLASGPVDPDRLYYGTDVRAAEFLAGALLGTAFARRRDWFRANRGWLDRAGWVALLVTLALWAGADIDDRWVYRGGLLAAVVPSVVLVAGATADRSLTRALAIGPLRVVGRASYLAYVVHWPLVLWLSPERTGLSGAALLPIQVGASVAIAVVARTVIEQPIRAGRVLAAPRGAIAAVACSGLLLAATWPIVAAGPSAPFDFDAELAAFEAATSTTGDGAGRVAYFGDSTATLLGNAMNRWASTHDELATAGGSVTFGCGLLGVSEVRSLGVVEQRRFDCAGWQERWSTTVAEGRPDVAIVSTVSDVLDVRGPGQERFTSIEDPDHRAALLERMVEAVDLLSADGAHVLWVRQPHVGYGSVDGRPPTRTWPENDPARMDAYNELVDQLPSLRPGKVTVVDLGARLAAEPGGEMDPSLRPDLVHYGVAYADELAATLLAPAALAVLDGTDGPTTSAVP